MRLLLSLFVRIDARLKNLPRAPTPSTAGDAEIGTGRDMLVCSSSSMLCTRAEKVAWAPPKMREGLESDGWSGVKWGWGGGGQVDKCHVSLCELE